MTLESNAAADRQARLADAPDNGTVECERSRCPNCSSELVGEYCPRCGQRRIHPQDLSARRYFRELADQIATLHERFKTLRTLRTLLVPGLLSAEFIAGRRQPYLTPFKVYVVCAAMFFLAAPTAGFTLASMLETDQSGTLRRLASARAADRGLAPPLFNARFDVRVQSVYTITLGAAAVVFALLLQWLFRKQRRPYGAHLIFALHYVAFMYLVTIVVGVSHTIGLSVDVAVAAGYAVILPYLILALKRVYAESIGVILWKAALVLLLTLALNNLASFAAIRMTFALV
jgi:hypothetical protein